MMIKWLKKKVWQLTKIIFVYEWLHLLNLKKGSIKIETLNVFSLSHFFTIIENRNHVVIQNIRLIIIMHCKFFQMINIITNSIQWMDTKHSSI